MKRLEGRRNDQLRKVKIIPNFLNHPIGSALIDMGGTKVICAVSFEPGVPPWMRQQGVPGGWVTCEYGLLPASTHQRCQREASKGKQSGDPNDFRADLIALGISSLLVFILDLRKQR